MQRPSRGLVLWDTQRGIEEATRLCHMADGAREAIALLFTGDSDSSLRAGGSQASGSAKDPQVRLGASVCDTSP